MDSVFPQVTVPHLVGSAGFVLTTWLCVYLVSHVPRSVPSRLAILCLFTLSGYFLHVVLCMFLPADQIGHLWRRYMGWVALIPLPLWLHLTSALLPSVHSTRQRMSILLTYLVSAYLTIVWILGSWNFSRTTLLPPELIWPITLFAIGVGTISLINIWKLWHRAADPTLRLRYALLGAVGLLLMGWILYWPVTVNWLKLPWSPGTRLAVGDSLPLAGSVVLAYAVAYHSAFMAGRWVKRDFFFNAATVGSIAGLYVLTLLGVYALARIFSFDTLKLTLITVVGLALSTHLLAERARRLWDSLFFKQLQALPSEMSSLVADANTSSGRRLEGQMMAALVNRLRDLTGASIVCVALQEEQQLIVKASTDRERIGRTVPIEVLSNGSLSTLHLSRAAGENGHNIYNLDCLVLAEPIRVNDQSVGFLLLGERGMGEGYGRVDRMWICALAAHLGAALEQARRREENARLLSQLKAEAKELAAQELSLQRKFEAVLSAPPPRIDPQELREAIYAYNHPDQLEAILTRDGSTLADLPYVAMSNASPALSFQRKLASALDSIAPDVLPSLESLRNRAIRSKRRRHLPASAANYHTLRLVMDGYTHEAIAEMLEVSPRQVRNYLDRGVGSLKSLLEQQAPT